MLQGRFIRPDGSGLESSEVLLFRGDDSAGLGEVEPCLRTVVGPDGEFSIAEHELPTGPMFVVASCSGWRGRSRLVELGEGQVELNLVIVAEPKPEIAVAEGERAEVAAIHGVILDADGHPVVGAFVVARRGVPLDDSAASRCRERASTMRDGAFALGDLEPGTWYVGVLDLDEAVHWRSEPLAIGPGEEHRVTFVMPALP